MSDERPAMTTPTGPYTANGSGCVFRNGEAVMQYIGHWGCEDVAREVAMQCNSAYHSARAPLLKMLRECELCLTSLMDESGLPPESRATLTRIRAALKETDATK